jgi:uncharacterized RDD family membrane protein YckC
LDPADKLTIDTPEQIPLELPLAGIGSRALALAIDSLLQLAVVILLLLFAVALAAAFDMAAVGDLGMAVAFALVPFLMQWGYFVFFEIRWNGQTPGKRLVKIRVIKESGRPVTAMEAAGRNLMRAIDMLPGVYAAGLVCMMLNKGGKRLGDYVAGTVVVYDKPVDHAHVIWSPGEGAAPAADDATRGGRISPDELALVETYLNRRASLDVAVRRETAARIAEVVGRRNGSAPADGQTADAFLESLARKARDSAGYR